MGTGVAKWRYCNAKEKRTAQFFERKNFLSFPSLERVKPVFLVPTERIRTQSKFAALIREGGGGGPAPSPLPLLSSQTHPSLSFPLSSFLPQRGRASGLRQRERDLSPLLTFSLETFLPSSSSHSSSSSSFLQDLFSSFLLTPLFFLSLGGWERAAESSQPALREEITD